MEDYNKLLNRFDNVLKENEALKEDKKDEQLGNLHKIKEIKALKDEIKELKEDRTFEGINNRINKFNTYYVSQIKAIRTIANETRNYELFEDALNDILSICNDTAIDFDGDDKRIDRIINAKESVYEFYEDEINELKKEISKLHEMNWELSKLLNKEIKEDNSELFKYVDELNNNINLTNKGGE